MKETLLLWALSWIAKRACNYFAVKHPVLKEKVEKVQAELETIKSRKEAAKLSRDNDSDDPQFGGGKLVALLLVGFVLAGCSLRSWDWLRLGDSGTTLPTTPATTIGPVPATTQPPKPVDYRGGYQAWPLSLDRTNLVTVPAFQFSAWGTRDQPLPAGVGAKYPQSFFWKLEETVYGEITVTNGEASAGFFFVRVDAKTLRKATLTIASDGKLYVYTPDTPSVSKYPVPAAIQ